MRHPSPNEPPRSSDNVPLPWEPTQTRSNNDPSTWGMGTWKTDAANTDDTQASNAEPLPWDTPDGSPPPLPWEPQTGPREPAAPPSSVTSPSPPPPPSATRGVFPNAPSAPPKPSWPTGPSVPPTPSNSPLQSSDTDVANRDYSAMRFSEAEKGPSGYSPVHVGSVSRQGRGGPDLADFGYVPDTNPLGRSSLLSLDSRDRRFWPSTPERKFWHYVVSAPFLLPFIIWPFILGTRVPILGMMDLAIHEAGHLLTNFLPSIITLWAGSGFQTLIPLGIAAGMWYKSRDPLGTSLALAWAGSNLQDVSVYIADAPYERLPLLHPGLLHDWATLLGPQYLDAMELARPLAGLTWTAGLASLLVGLGIFGRYAWIAKNGVKPTPEPDNRSFKTTQVNSWTSKIELE